MLDEIMNALRTFEQNHPGIEVLEPISDTDELVDLLESLKQEWGIEDQAQEESES